MTGIKRQLFSFCCTQQTHFFFFASTFSPALCHLWRVWSKGRVSFWTPAGTATEPMEWTCQIEHTWIICHWFWLTNLKYSLILIIIFVKRVKSVYKVPKHLQQFLNYVDCFPQRPNHCLALCFANNPDLPASYVYRNCICT